MIPMYNYRYSIYKYKLISINRWKDKLGSQRERERLTEYIYFEYSRETKLY